MWLFLSTNRKSSEGTHNNPMSAKSTTGWKRRWWKRWGRTSYYRAISTCKCPAFLTSNNLHIVWSVLFNILYILYPLKPGYLSCSGHFRVVMYGALIEFIELCFCNPFAWCVFRNRERGRGRCGEHKEEELSMDHNSKYMIVYLVHVALLLCVLSILSKLMCKRTEMWSAFSCLSRSGQKVSA